MGTAFNLPIDTLSVEEKIPLMERLWEDLSRRPSDMPSPNWHGDILAERQAAVREGRTPFVEWESAKQSIARSLEMRIRLLPEAECDLELGADFYESQGPGLGMYFTDCLATDIDSLALFGGIHEKYCGSYCSRSKRFPFMTYNKIDGDHAEVYAVLDARQDPKAIDATLPSHIPEPHTRNVVFSIRSLLYAVTLIAWILGVNNWLGNPYGWLTAIPLVIGLPIYFIKPQTCLGALLGFIVFAIVGDLYLIGWDRAEPQYLPSIATVGSYGSTVGCSLHAFWLGKRWLSCVACALTLISFVVVLRY